MAAPQLPIDVNEDTGVWTTDGLPMLYVPQHFFVNNHKAIEAELGQEAYAALLHRAGYKSAWFWCDEESKTHGITGVEVFHHYMKRLSQRGWGLFYVDAIDMAAGTARIRLEHSAFVAQYGLVNRPVCYMFLGWLVGSLEWVAKNMGNDFSLIAEEQQCGATGHEHCVFAVRKA